MADNSNDSGVLMGTQPSFQLQPRLNTTGGANRLNLVRPFNHHGSVDQQKFIKKEQLLSSPVL